MTINFFILLLIDIYNKINAYVQLIKQKLISYAYLSIRSCYAWDYVTKPARNDVPIACENISEQTDCQKATWGTQQLEEYANQSFMAVWTFTVPAKKCVNIQFNISNFTKDDDRLFVKFSDGLDPVHMHQEELFSINRMAMNRTVISIFFSYRSLQFPRMHFTFKLTNLDCSCEPPNISLNN